MSGSLVRPDDIEESLNGGNVADSVVRTGQTVRKPVTKSTPSVEALLVYLAESGFLHAPRSLGRDERGRYILEYVAGTPVTDPSSLSAEDLFEIGSVIRNLHLVAADSPMSPSQTWNVAIPQDRTELICHNDLGPWNLIRNEGRWVFIDWDGSGPSSRLWDLAYAAQSFVPLIYGGDPRDDASRLRTFLDGYRLELKDRILFPNLLYRRTFAMYRLLENGAKNNLQPWARMFLTGHGDHWLKASQYIEKHLPEFTSSLSP
jgi:hypothetical protein